MSERCVGCVVIRVRGGRVAELAELLPLPFVCRRRTHTAVPHHTMHATRLAYHRATIPCCQPLELCTISDESAGRPDDARALSCSCSCCWFPLGLRVCVRVRACVTNGERADSAASIGASTFRPVLARQRAPLLKPTVGTTQGPGTRAPSAPACLAGLRGLLLTSDPGTHMAGPQRAQSLTRTASTLHPGPPDRSLVPTPLWIGPAAPRNHLIC